MCRPCALISVHRILSLMKRSGILVLRIAFQARRNYYGRNYYGLLPLVFLIVYALKTRKMAESMILATLLAMVLVHRQNFLTGTIDAMYATLSNSSYRFALCAVGVAAVSDAAFLLCGLI